MVSLFWKFWWWYPVSLLFTIAIAVYVNTEFFVSPFYMIAFTTFLTIFNLFLLPIFVFLLRCLSYRKKKVAFEKSSMV